jgi:hypothetical protein
MAHKTNVCTKLRIPPNVEGWVPGYEECADIEGRSRAPFTIGCASLVAGETIPQRHYTSFTKVPLLIEVNTKKKCYELRESPEMCRIDHEGIATRVTKEKVRYRDTLGK